MSDLLLSRAIDYWDSPSYAGFPYNNSLISDFCSSQPLFCHQLPSDSTSRWTPLPRLAIPIDTARSGLTPHRNTPCLATRKPAALLRQTPLGTVHESRMGWWRVTLSKTQALFQQPSSEPLVTLSTSKGSPVIYTEIACEECL